MPIRKAVPKAVDYCIEHNILTEFLIKNKSEVVAMSILECNYEVEMEKIKRGLEKQANERALKEIESKYGEQIKANLEKKLYDSVKSELRDKLSDSIKSELRDKLSDSVKAELCDKLSDSVKAELRDKLAPQVEEIRNELYDSILLEQINKKLQKGKSPEVIADELEQPLEVINKLLSTIDQNNQ